MITHREHFLRQHGLSEDKHYSLQELSKISHVPLAALKECFKRGVGAWTNNISSVRLKKDFSKNPNLSAYPRSARLTKQQWAYARVYSLLDKGTTYYTADSDLVEKYSI
jgi:hypothetical protein